MSTPDIFISYAHNDAGTARRFADAFIAEGLDVWWDDSLQAGEVFDEAIETALRAARAVVVLWSPDAVASRWVRAEATLADRNKTLVPALIAPCSLPIVFELTQTPDLSHWRGERSDAAWLGFLAGVRRYVTAARASEPAIVTPRAAPLPALNQASIVVLPFTNMSRDEDQEYFADGISEDIITDLSKVSALRVISRNSAFVFKGRSVDVTDVARQLNVSHVLEGSVRKAGNRVRVTAQLIDGSTNDHVWAERYDRDLADIFDLQDELSRAIVKALKVKLLPAEKKAIDQRATTDAALYDKYLRARALLHQQGGDELLHASRLFREIIAEDAAFVPAWRGLYAASLDLMVWAPAHAAEAQAAMDEAHAKIRALAPDAWWSHAIGCWRLIEQRRWVEAEAEIDAAWANAPADDPELLTTQFAFLAAVGRVREEEKVLLRLRASDPLSLLISTYVQAPSDLEEFGDQEAEYERSQSLSGHRELTEAFAVFRALLRGDPPDAVRARLRVYLAHESVLMPELRDLDEIIFDRETMVARLREALNAPANQDGTRQIKIAIWAAYHREFEIAAVGLRRFALDLPGGRLGTLWLPILREVVASPAGKAILRELGLHHYWRTSGHWGDFVRPLGEDDFEVIAS